MIALKRILVPTDFSECSGAAVTYATALARAFDAELHVLHVPEHPGEAAETEFPIGLFENMQNAAHDRLGKLLSDEDQRVLRTQFAMRIGSPYGEIVRYAQERDIDLIVMGTHGRGFVAHMLIGSVAEKVVRKAPCPVLTVHHPQHEFVVAEEPQTRGARVAG
jgi:nucleotide-binding universal stress UspA family protein